MFAKVDSVIPDGFTTQVFAPTGDAALHIQVDCAPGVVSIVEGQIAPDATKTPDTFFAEIARFTGPGIFGVKLVPTFLRIRASGGVINAIRIQGYEDARRVVEE